jgi:hypothetical protein
MATTFIDETIDKSKGLGLFAASDIKEGEQITVYPTHTIREKEDTEFDPYSLSFKGVVYTTKQERPSKLPSSPLSATDEYGHLINDASIPNFSEKWSLGKIFQSLKSYIVESLKLQNAKLDQTNPKPVYIATKPIKKGEEILITYGCLYWVEKYYGNLIYKFFSTLIFTSVRPIPFLRTEADMIEFTERWLIANLRMNESNFKGFDQIKHVAKSETKEEAESHIVKFFASV